MSVVKKFIDIYKKIKIMCIVAIILISIWYIIIKLSNHKNNYSKEETKQSKIIAGIVTILLTVISGIFLNILDSGTESILNDTEVIITESIEQFDDTSGSGMQTEFYTQNSDYEEGQLIVFGKYPIDDEQTKPVFWRILDVQEDKILILSEYALEHRCYHPRKENVTWAQSEIREWLNGTFYCTAFNEDEQTQILDTYITASPNPLYPTYSGDDTLDHIFLLSIDEAENYFGSDYSRIAQPTKYAIKQGAYVSQSTGGSWWWLRSPGITSQDAASVNTDGSIDYDDGSINSAKGTIRPALWLSID